VVAEEQGADETEPGECGRGEKSGPLGANGLASDGEGAVTIRMRERRAGIDERRWRRKAKNGGAEMFMQGALGFGPQRVERRLRGSFERREMPTKGGVHAAFGVRLGRVSEGLEGWLGCGEGRGSDSGAVGPRWGVGNGCGEGDGAPGLAGVAAEVCGEVGAARTDETPDRVKEEERVGGIRRMEVAQGCVRREGETLAERKLPRGTLGGDLCLGNVKSFEEGYSDVQTADGRIGGHDMVQERLLVAVRGGPAKEGRSHWLGGVNVK
jgi:hypothetical protein